MINFFDVIKSIFIDVIILFFILISINSIASKGTELDLSNIELNIKNNISDMSDAADNLYLVFQRTGGFLEYLVKTQYDQQQVDLK